ncbi:hypothetical protein BH09SUM1_BH09SUM1_17780 [soil metagenome]
MVCYDFPPSSVGIWRTLKFCRYMGEFGWKPYILTVKPVRGPLQDEGPLKELPPGTAVRRTGSLDPGRIAHIVSGSQTEGKTTIAKKNTNATGRRVLDVFRRWVFVPDDRMGWIPFAKAEGRRWLREEKFDAIYSTSFPASAHVVGASLAKKSGLPYLADFRDIWIGNYVFYQPATGLHDKFQRRLERRVVETAGRVVSATGPITEDFRQRHPEQNASKFVTITNGFDAEDFVTAGVEADASVYTITYAGTMYGSTNPQGFFRAVRALLEKEPRWRTVLRLRFVGSMIEPFRAMIGECGLSDITRVEPYAPHDEALRIMAEADALLLIVSTLPGSHIMLTQKVFEYAAARRPVIGLVPEGAAREFLQEIDEGPIVHPEDEAGIEAALRGMLTEWERDGRKMLGENVRLEKYQRRTLTRALCAELDAIAR